MLTILAEMQLQNLCNKNSLSVIDVRKLILETVKDNIINIELKEDYKHHSIVYTFTCKYMEGEEDVEYY